MRRESNSSPPPPHHSQRTISGSPVRPFKLHSSSIFIFITLPSSTRQRPLSEREPVPKWPFICNARKPFPSWLSDKKVVEPLSNRNSNKQFLKVPHEHNLQQDPVEDLCKMYIPGHCPNPANQNPHFNVHARWSSSSQNFKKYWCKVYN